jgi:hypothetical protein
MEAAFTASEESSPSAPDVSTESSTPDPVAAVPESPAATDTAPPPSDTGAVPEKAPGPIPFDRHQAVLAAERAKHAWAEKYGAPEAIQQRLAVTEWAERDPVGFLRTYAANQGIDLQQLMPQPAAPPPPVEEAPQPDILLENGQTTYSHEQLQKLLSFERRQMQQQFSQELAPIKQERAVSQLQQQALGHAKQQLATAATWPGFKEHEADMKAFLKANPTATLNDAYINVVPAKLAAQVESAKTSAYQEALTTLTTKAGAASIPAPRTAGTPATDTSSMSLRDHLEAALGG